MFVYVCVCLDVCSYMYLYEYIDIYLHIHICIYICMSMYPLFFKNKQTLIPWSLIATESSNNQHRIFPFGQISLLDTAMKKKKKKQEKKGVKYSKIIFPWKQNNILQMYILCLYYFIFCGYFVYRKCFILDECFILSYLLLQWLAFHPSVETEEKEPFGSVVTNYLTGALFP